MPSQVDPWVCNSVSKFWPYFQAVCFDFLNGYKILALTFRMPKFCMCPLNLMPMKAQTRKLEKCELLFSKVGKSKQIRKMAITPVLTMLTSTFWAHFASLYCPHQISKNQDAIFSFTEKVKNSLFN